MSLKIYVPKDSFLSRNLCSFTGLDALEEVIRHIETYDITTVRASTPMYLLARRIKASGTKMVLSGEGADEVHKLFGGDAEVK